MKSKTKLTAEQRKKTVDIFNEYFTEYYQNNNEVKSVSYYEMKENQGYSAVLQYKNFIQYVNIYWDKERAYTVNTCFVFNSKLSQYLCHFSNLLDDYDSDDINCYNYIDCASKDVIHTALNEIMSATEKHFSKLNEAAQSDYIQQSIFDEMYGDDMVDFDDIDVYSVEEDTDYTYLIYEASYERLELKKYLARRARRNKLENKYEIRAHRVLSRESHSETKKKSADSISRAKKDEGKIGLCIPC